MAMNFCINFHICEILAELLPTNNRFLLLTLFILIILIFLLIHFPSPSLDCHMFPYSRPSWLTLGSLNRKVPLTAVGQQVGHHHHALSSSSPNHSHPLQWLEGCHFAYQQNRIFYNTSLKLMFQLLPNVCQSSRLHPAEKCFSGFLIHIWSCEPFSKVGDF